MNDAQKRRDVQIIRYSDIQKRCSDNQIIRYSDIQNLKIYKSIHLKIFLKIYKSIHLKIFQKKSFYGKNAAAKNINTIL